MPYRSFSSRLLSVTFIAFFCTVSAWAIASKTEKEQTEPNTYEEFNYRFEEPGWPWESMDPRFINEDAKTAYRSTVQDAFFIIIPEVVGVEYGFASKDLADSSVMNMKSISPSASFSERETVTLNGVEWLNFTGTLEVSGQKLVYGYLVHSSNGYGYQLITWRAGSFDGLAKSDVLELGAKFHLIEEGRIAKSPDFVPLDQVSHPESGVSADFSNTKWTAWPLGDADLPFAALNATQMNQVFFSVTPLYHRGLNPSYKDLKAAFLAQILNLDVSTGFSSRDKLVRKDEDRFLESRFKFTNMQGGTNHTLAQIIKRDNVSYLLVGFSEDESLLSEVEAALDTVEIGAPANLEGIDELLTPEARFFQSGALNFLAINAYSQGNYINARRFLSAAIEYDNSDPTLAVNFGAICSDQGDFQSIINLYEADVDAYDENYPFREYYAMALYRTNQLDTAESEYTTIFDSGNLSETGLYFLMEMLAGQERWDDGFALAEDFAEFTGSNAARQWAAGFQTSAGNYEKAHTILMELKEIQPFDLSIDHDIANNYLQESKYNAALETIAAVEADMDSYPLLYTVKGNALFGLKSYMKAKEAYQIAVDLNPLDEEAKSMLEFATLALGKGDTAVNDEPIDAVVLLPEAEKAGAAAVEKKIEGDESLILFSHLSVQYEKEKIHRSTRRVKVAIRDDAGLDSYSTLGFTFDPFAESVYINEITVKDLEGNVISREERDDFYILDNSDEMVVSQDRTLYAPVSGLTKSCTLEYVVTYNSIGIVDTFPLIWEDLTYLQETRVSTLSVAGDTKDVASKGYHGMEKKKAKDGLLWIAHDIPAYKAESYQADIETFAPYLVLTEESASWEAEVEEYFEEVKDRLELSEAIIELATSKVDGLQSEEEKIAAIYRFIQTDFTYKALSFGPRAQIPNTADKIVKDRYGDCKDLALLANRMLEAVGVNSHLALVHTDSRVEKSLPSLDQFNHMILYLPDYQGGHFIDCTSQKVSLQLATPLGLDEKDILVLDWAEPRFIRSQAQQIEQNRITVSRHVTLDDDAAIVEETLVLDGLPAAYFREYLGTMQKQHTLDSFQSLMATRGGNSLRLESVEPENLDAITEPLRIRFEYSVPRAIRRTAKGFTLSSIPSFWERYYLEVPFSKERKTPFDIRNPLRFDSDIVMDVPDGVSLAEGQLASETKSTDFHSFEHRRSLPEGSRTLSLHHSIQLPSQSHPAEAFRDFQDSAYSALSLLDDSLEFIVAD